jgi:hypothetical protein
MLEKLRFPEQLGRCRGIPLVFVDTNVLIDADGFVKTIFRKQESEIRFLSGVLCDFIEGEARNLRKGQQILEELKLPEYLGFYFETSYNSQEGSERSLKDMPTGEMAEAVLVEYDRKLDPSGILGATDQAKSAARSKSRYGDFSLVTVAALAAFKRKKQSIIISRDRWIKLSCKSLQEKFRLPVFCYDQWNYSIDEITLRAQKEIQRKE